MHQDEKENEINLMFKEAEEQVLRQQNQIEAALNEIYTKPEQRKQIVGHVFDGLKNGKAPKLVFSELRIVLNRISEFDIGFAELIFSEINERFKIEKEELISLPDKEKSQRNRELDNSLQVFKNAAKIYYKKCFREVMPRPGHEDYLPSINELLFAVQEPCFVELLNELKTEAESEIESQLLSEKAEMDDFDPNQDPIEKFLTARQIVMFLLTLMYGSPKVPDVVDTADVVKFITLLKALDTSNVSKLINPTKAKAESIKERQARIKDIQAVTKCLKNLGVDEQRWSQIEEKTLTALNDDIQNIKSFTQEDEEEKRNFR